MSKASAGGARAMLAVLAGLLVGSAVNMGLILVGGKLVTPPDGADVTTMEGLKATIHLFEFRHFVFPFLAHALGTLAGAFIASFIAPARSATAAAFIGVLFLLGGVANVVVLPAPAWFNAADLLLAYLPTAWLGWWMAMQVRATLKRDERRQRE
ncbi:hypothetical protein [Piscinibacter sakaiensis]|uniref:hypothetical protein n=1 Tax=Piscinibacter sakaiensis TaxID=1547922 RepID=UPI003AAF39F8